MYIDCAECLENEELRAQSGCEEPVEDGFQIDQDYDEIFYNCPKRFITQDVENFRSKYMYNSITGSSKEYEKESARYTDALFFYRSCYNKYIEELSKRKPR